MKAFSIVMITNNDAECLAGTIESIIKDTTDIPCYLIVYDDCSKDETQSILEKYALEYPEKIAFIPGENPIGEERAAILISNIIETDYYCIIKPGEWKSSYISETQQGQNLLDKEKELQIYQAVNIASFMMFRKNNNNPEDKKSKPIIPFLVVCVGQACNLKCKNCGNFAPFSAKEYMRYEVNDIIADLANIFNYFKIKDLQIQGGEPLIYSDLDRLLLYLGNNENVENITIATNGIHVPSDRVLELVARYKVTIRISNYVEVGHSTEALKNKIDEKGIVFKEWHFASGVDVWNYLGGTEVVPENDDVLVAKRFRNCKFKICTTLENGEIVHCSRGVNASRIQGFPTKKKDSVIVRGNDNLRDELIDYINEMNYMEACRYCYGTDSGKYCIPAEQV